MNTMRLYLVTMKGDKVKMKWPITAAGRRSSSDAGKAFAPPSHRRDRAHFVRSPAEGPSLEGIRSSHEGFHFMAGRVMKQVGK